MIFRIPMQETLLMFCRALSIATLILLFQKHVLRDAYGLWAW